MQREAIVTHNTRRPTNNGNQLLQGGLAAQILKVKSNADAASGSEIPFRTHYHHPDPSLEVRPSDSPESLGVPLFGRPCASR